MNQTSATIIESSGKTVDFKEEAGIFSCLLEHEIKATKATFSWKGPKITQAQWNEMLAFFKWTFDEHKSEAQVRLFVHPTLGWKIWAFPQKGGTSMTTNEVDNEDSKLQRAAIPEGYIPFGTVHHHCGIGAFQSGTDQMDENTVDGLHITIGKLGDAQYDIHCRLYLKKNKFEPNMASFWEVGEEAQQMAEWVASLNFNVNDILNREARMQMTIPAPAETAFPEIWKANYILPQTTNSLIQGKWCWHCQNHTDHSPEACPDKDKDAKKSRRRKKGHRGLYSGPAGNMGTSDWWEERTWEELMDSAKAHNLTDIEVAEILTVLGGPEASGFYADLIELASDNYKSMSDMYDLAQDKWSDGAGEQAETAEERISADAQAAADLQKEIDAENRKTGNGRTQEEMVKIWNGQMID